LMPTERRFAHWMNPEDAYWWGWGVDSFTREVCLGFNDKVRTDERILDLSDCLDDLEEDVFIDWMHLTGRGNQVVAEAIFPAIVNALRLNGNNKQH